MIERSYDGLNDKPDIAPQRELQPGLVKTAERGHIQGEIGAVLGLDHDASLSNVYDDGYYMSVETIVTLDDRAVMTMLSVANGEGLFEPGLSTSFSLENYDPDAMQVTMLGCVGQDVGVYDEYDMPADEVDVVVADGADEGSMLVQLEGRWFERDTDGFKTDVFHPATTQFTLRR